MGTLIEIGGLEVAVETLSMTEASVPTVATDTSGAVANFTLGIRSARPVTYWLGLKDSEITIKDARYGETTGRVEGLSFPSPGSVQMTCVSRMGLLSAYGIKAKPFVGTLRAAFIHYLALGSITSGYSVAADLADTPVALPGWSGELWFYLKQLAVAYGCDIGIVDNIITVESNRARTLPEGAAQARSINAPGGQLAQAVEVNLYETKSISGALVYPPGGWKPETDVITVNAGETIEQILQLNASVSSVTQPAFRTVVAPGYSTTSVYSVVGDDGLPITAAAWRGGGGKLSVTINEDTTSLTLKVTAPESLPSRRGDVLKTYSLALASDTSIRYSTLRIVGTGVSIKKETLRISTGVTPSRTATDVGATIDNIFLNDRGRAKRAGIRAAKRYTGRAVTLSGTIVRPQKFGEVAGSRLWDVASNRFLRVRTATFALAGISYDADSDLLHSDVDSALAGKTYASVKAALAGMTYGQVTMKGVPADE